MPKNRTLVHPIKTNFKLLENFKTAQQYVLMGFVEKATGTSFKTWSPIFIFNFLINVGDEHVAITSVFI